MADNKKSQKSDTGKTKHDGVVLAVDGGRGGRAERKVNSLSELAGVDSLKRQGVRQGGTAHL